MRQMKYFNALLTINAVLMALVLWTQLVGGGQPLLSTPAQAQAQKSPGFPEGVPNAGMQRQTTIDELRALRNAVDATRNLLQGAPIKVQVMNLEEMKVAGGKAETAGH